MTVKQLDPLFSGLRDAIVPLVKAVGESPNQPDTSFLDIGQFPEDKQREFSNNLKAVAPNGIDVIYISNHGGRQLDHGLGGCDLISEISQTVKNKAKIFFDGGVLRGTDVVKAIALGADLVGIGRLQCYAAAAGGKEGLNRMIEILYDEFLICLRLLGVNSLNELNHDYIIREKATQSPSLTSSFPLIDEGY